MNENECCTLHFKICRLQLNFLQHHDDSLAIDHSEVVNSSTSNAQFVLAPWGCAAMTSTFYYIHLVLHCLQCYLWMWHTSSQCSVFGNTLKPEHAMKTRNTTCVLN